MLTVKFGTRQSNGEITFEFLDNSYCVAAFSFSRVDGVDEFMLDATSFSTSFTSDFYYNAAGRCNKGKNELSPCSICS